jgi:hypothetical protein
MLTYADVCSRMLTYVDVCSRMLSYADRFTLRDMLVSRALGDRNASIPYTVIDDSSENRFEGIPHYYTDVAAVACFVAALLQLTLQVRGCTALLHRCMCSAATVCVFYVCVLILLCVCPHTAIYASS